MRDQKIILSKQLRETPSRRITRDNSCQTELTLPPVLPKEVEEALRPYFTYTQNQQRTPVKISKSPSDNISMSSDSVIDHDARDASLRRKLFQIYANTSEHSTESKRDVYLDSPAPQTPEMVRPVTFHRHVQLNIFFKFILFHIRISIKFDLVASQHHKISLRMKINTRLNVSRSVASRQYQKNMQPRQIFNIEIWHAFAEKVIRHHHRCCFAVHPTDRRHFDGSH